MKLTKKQQTFNELADIFWEKGYELYQIATREQNQLVYLNLPKDVYYYLYIHFDDCPKELKKYYSNNKLFLNKSAAKKFIQKVQSIF